VTWHLRRGGSDWDSAVARPVLGNRSRGGGDDFYHIDNIIFCTILFMCLIGRAEQRGALPPTTSGLLEQAGSKPVNMKRFLMEGMSWTDVVRSCHDVEAYLQTTLLFKTMDWITIHQGMEHGKVDRSFFIEPG
jgi:hypothetical protein